MKSMRFIAPALVAVCLLVVPLAWSQGGNVEQQIKKLTDQVIAAESCMSLRPAAISPAAL